MKKITIAIIAILMASLVFVLSGCEITLGGDKDENSETGSHTAIIEITDEAGSIIATETVTISDDEIQQGNNFFVKDTANTTKPSGVSNNRVQEAIKNNTTTTANTENSKDETSNTPGTTGSGNVATTPRDAIILESTQYMLIGRVEKDGESIPYKIARSGDKVALYTIYNEQQIGFIILEDSILALSADEKTYLQVSKELIKESATDEEMLETLNGSALDKNRELILKSKQKEDGVLYDVYAYDTGEKDYFIGDTIIKSTASDGSVLYYDTVSAVVPSSVFTPPADYTKQTLNEENVSDFAEIIDTTEAHTHEDE